MEVHKIIKKKIKKILIDLSKKNNTIRAFFRYARHIENKCRYMIYHFSDIDDNTIIFESFMGRKYSDNPRAVYEYLLNDNKYKAFKFIWAFKDIDKYKTYDALGNKRTQIVKYGSRSYYQAYGTSKYWISNSRIPEAIYKKRGQVYVQCWHGTPLKKLGYDIEVEGKNALNSNKDIRKKYKDDAKRYSYMLSSSKFCTEKFISAFNLKALGKENVIIEQGFPRNDILSNYCEEEVLKIKERLGLPKDKKVILYAPTWRDDQHRSGKGYVYSNELDLDMLNEALSDSYVVLFRVHYFVTNSFDFSKHKGFVYDVSDIDDINELYLISDMLITDYSSVFFDYAILEKPIFFYMYDLENYRDQVRGFYLNLDELPGEIITNEMNLVKKIQKSVANTKTDYNEMMKAFNKKFNYLHDGNASRRFIQNVF